MDSIGNQYLDEIRTSVRLRPIPWEGYVRADLLTAEEATPFKALEKRPAKERNADVQAKPSLYVDTVLSLLERRPRDDVTKYLVLFAGDEFAAVPEFASALLADERSWHLIAGLLDQQQADEQTGLLAARLLAAMAVSEISPPASLSALLDFVSSKLLPSPNTSLQDLGAQSLASLLQTKAYRAPFWERHEKLVPRINELIASSSGGGLQVQYYALLTLWLATFDRTIATKIVADYDSVAVLLDAAKSSVKEKIIRVAVATLLNLTEAAPRSAASALVAQRGLLIVSALADRKWADEELQADIQDLKQRLESAYERMSTFDVYRSELKSKHLQWSPPHKAAAFWKQNIDEFRKENWAVLRELVALISPDSDKVTEAVACSDITNIITESPDAVSVLGQEGAKARIMELLNSSDVEVRYEALRATQAFIGHMFQT